MAYEDPGLEPGSAIATTRRGLNVGWEPDHIDEHLEFGFLLAGPPSPRKGEGLFHRTLRNEAGESCLQLIFFYRVQLFPYHPCDYAPIFLFFGANGSVDRVYHDAGHHRAAPTRPSRRSRFTVLGPWHSIHTRIPRIATRMSRPHVQPMSDAQILRWWYRPGVEQLKLREKLWDPWSLVRQHEEGGPTTFRDLTVCPSCGRATLHDGLDIEMHRFMRTVACPCGRAYEAGFDPETDGMSAG